MPQEVARVNQLLDNYEKHFEKRVDEYLKMGDKKFIFEYYGYLRVVQDIKAHILAGKVER